MSDGLVHEMRAGDTLVFLPGNGGPAVDGGAISVTLMEKSGRRARVRVDAPSTVEVKIRNQRGRILDRRTLLEA